MTTAERFALTRDALTLVHFYSKGRAKAQVATITARRRATQAAVWKAARLQAIADDAVRGAL